jgi:hypothetical protein
MGGRERLSVSRPIKIARQIAEISGKVQRLASNFGNVWRPTMQTKAANGQVNLQRAVGAPKAKSVDTGKKDAKKSVKVGRRLVCAQGWKRLKIYDITTERPPGCQIAAARSLDGIFPEILHEILHRDSRSWRSGTPHIFCAAVLAHPIDCPS